MENWALLTPRTKSDKEDPFCRLLKCGIKRCNALGLSPLETTLAESLTSVTEFQRRDEDDDPCQVGHWPELRLALLAQPGYGHYQPDFVVASTGHAEGERPSFILVVEVDGHGHHSTPGQIRSDKQRDDTMIATGVAKVLRFTGAEVWANHNECAEKVINVAISLRGRRVFKELIELSQLRRVVH